jgi:hypothetical protein
MVSILSPSTFTSSYQLRNPYVGKDLKETIPCRIKTGIRRRTTKLPTATQNHNYVTNLV